MAAIPVPEAAPCRPGAPVPAYPPGPVGWARRAVRGLGGLLLSSFISIRVENAPDFDRLGPVILAPNHTSYLDPPVLQCACSHHLTFLMTEVIYHVRVARWFFSLWGAIPVGEGRVSAGTMKAALGAIRSGRPVVIFPEGRISKDGFLNEGRGGVVMLVVKGGVPVIPVAIVGTHHALPRGAWWPRRGRVLVRFGDPIPPPGRLGRDEVPGFSARIMNAIHTLGAPRRPPAGPAPPPR